MSGINCSNNNGHIDRTVKKIKYIRKKKSTRNNVRARLKKEVQVYGDY